MKKKKNWLVDKTVIITGASSGIGKELTKLCLQNGTKVIGVARNKEKMENFANSIQDNKELFSYEFFDVSDNSAWQNFAKKLEKENTGVDLLVNNAGIMPKFDNFLNIDLDTGKKVMDINFYSVVYGTYNILPLTSAVGGVVNICSSDALLSVAGTNYYGASKGAVKCLTQSLRYEFPNKYIGIVFPGFTDTNIFANVGASEKDQKRMKKLMSPADKIAKKIFKAILKKKKYKVVGYDAHAFSMLSRWFPKGGATIVNDILRDAKVDMFSGVIKQ